MRLKDLPCFPKILWLVFGLFLCALSWPLFGSLLDLPHDLDDLPALRDNTKVAEDPWVLLHGFYHPSGRPTGHLLRWLVYLVWGNDLRVFHALSVAIHVANAFLVAFLGSRLGLHPRAYLAAGVLFLFHVAHFKAVHHVAALEYLLATTCALAATLALTQYLAQRTGCWLAAVYSAVVLAVASHIAASALLPLAAYQVWTRTGNDRRVWRALAPLLGLVLLLLYLLISQASSQRIPTTTGRAFHYMSASGLPDLFLTSAKMLVWLSAQLYAYAHLVVGHLWVVYDWQLCCGALVCAGLVWRVIGDRASPLTLSLAWSVVFLLPFALQDEQTIRDVPGPSRYLYLASVGSSLVLAHLLATLTSSTKRWIQGSALALAAAALLSSAVALKRMEALSYYTASLRYRAEGNLEHSRAFAERALADGRDVLPLEEAYTSLLLTQLSMDGEGARQRTQELLLQDPHSQTLGLFETVFAANDEQADWSGAEERLRALGRNDLVAAVFGGWARDQLRRDARRALISLQRALAFDPDNIQVLYLYGALLTDAGRLEGLRYYVRAVDLDRQYDRFAVLIGGLVQRQRLGEALAYVAEMDQTPAARRFAELARQALSQEESR